MNSNKQYQKLYEQEVNPQFTEKDWESFQKYRELRYRNRLFYLLAGLGVVSLILMIYFVSHQAINELQDQTTIIATKPGFNSKDKQETTVKGISSGNRDNQDNNQNNRESEQSITRVENKKQVAASTLNNNQKYSAKPDPSIKDKYPSGDPLIIPTPLDPETKVKDELSFHESNDRNHDNEREMIQLLAPRSMGMIGYHPPGSVTRIDHLPRLPVNSISPHSGSWQKNFFAGMIYGGTAFFIQNLTLDEQVHQFGISGYYAFAPDLRLKTGLELSSVDFVATEMNPKIGVEFQESPDERFSFQEAIVESMGLSIDIGLDYKIWHNDNWSLFTGVSYRMVREIRKGIEYEFQDVASESKEIFIKSDRVDRYFDPFLLKFEAGVSYQTKAGSLSFLIARPVPLSKNRITFLSQWQLNLGISHQF